MFTFAGYALLLYLNFVKSESHTRCFPLYDRRSLCFTQPDPPVALPWSSAMEWCKNIGATLPISDYFSHQTIYGNAIGYFGLQTHALWLGANSTYDPNDWYWDNGTRFTGTIENRNVSELTNAYVIRNGTEIKFVADSPSSYMYIGYICRHYDYYNTEVNCAHHSNTYWTDEKCYMKQSGSYSWTTYLSYCVHERRASYEDVKMLSRWLDDSTKYWVGLSRFWWTWQDIVTGRSYEVTESHLNFQNMVPNGTSAQCMASYYSYGSISWMSMGCNENLQFICQQYVNITTTTTTTTSTTTTPSTTRTSTTVTTTPTTSTSTTLTTSQTSSVTTTPTVESTDWWLLKSSAQTAKSNIESNNGMVIGLGVGLGGGLFLVVIAWLALITVYAYRQIRDAKQSAGNPVSMSGKSSNNYILNDNSGRGEMQEAGDTAYEALELQVK